MAAEALAAVRPARRTAALRFKKPFAASRLPNAACGNVGRAESAQRRSRLGRIGFCGPRTGYPCVGVP